MQSAMEFGIEEECLAERPTFRSRLVERLWRWWAGAGEGGVPAWSRFDITEHPQLVPNLFLVRQIGDAFHHRLFGEAAKSILGPRHKDVVVGRDGAGAFDQYLHDYYVRVLSSGKCWRCSGSLLFAGKQSRRFESIDVPFVRDGSAPDTILGVIDLVG